MENRRESTIRAALFAFIGVLVVLLVVIVVNITGLSVSTTSAARQNMVLWRGDDVDKSIDLSVAFQLGQERVKQWAVDAQLVRAEAAWRPTREGQKLEEPPVSWSLYFYSLQERALASTSVTGDQVFWVPPIKMTYVPKVLESLPSFDVEVAWLTFRAAGGDEFLLRHKDAMINFRLHVKDEGVVWSVTAFDDRDRYQVMIDANTGIIMDEVQN